MCCLSKTKTGQQQAEVDGKKQSKIYIIAQKFNVCVKMAIAEVDSKSVHTAELNPENLFENKLSRIVMVFAHPREKLGILHRSHPRRSATTRRGPRPATEE